MSLGEYILHGVFVAIWGASYIRHDHEHYPDRDEPTVPSPLTQSWLAFPSMVLLWPAVLAWLTVVSMRPTLRAVLQMFGAKKSFEQTIEWSRRISDDAEALVKHLEGK